MSALAAGLALLAALLYALASVTQQRSAATVPDRQAGGPALIRVLIDRPLWWLGVGADTGGFVAQSAALGLGALLLVQPLLVTTLLFALPLGAWWAGRRIARSDRVWAVLQQSAFQAGELSAALPAVTGPGRLSPGSR